MNISSLSNIPPKFYPFIALGITYLCSILKNFFLLREVAGCIKVLSNYLNSAIFTKGSHDFLNKKDNYQQCLNDVLLKFPIIQKYSGFYTGELEYGNSDISNYQTAYKLRNELMMKRNYLWQDLKASFNPIRSIKTLFSLPSLFLNWIGFEPGISFSRILNLGFWLIAYILDIYSSEIKVLINLFFQ